MELHLCKCITPKTPSNWYVKHMHHKTANAYGKALFMYDHVFKKSFSFQLILPYRTHSHKQHYWPKNKQTQKAKLKIHNIYTNIFIKF